MFVLGACALRPDAMRSQPDPSVMVVVDPGPDVIRPMARGGATASTPAVAPRRAEDFDRTSAAERTAAVQTARISEGRGLGQTLATLGPPAEQGFWLRTGLVTTPTPGRVTAQNGTSVAVELRPSGNAAGSGSQISLAALRALGLPLTAIAQLDVARLD